MPVSTERSPVPAQASTPEKKGGVVTWLKHAGEAVAIGAFSLGVVGVATQLKEVGSAQFDDEVCAPKLEDGPSYSHVEAGCSEFFEHYVIQDNGGFKSKAEVLVETGTALDTKEKNQFGSLVAWGAKGGAGGFVLFAAGRPAVNMLRKRRGPRPQKSGAAPAQGGQRPPVVATPRAPQREPVVATERPAAAQRPGPATPAGSPAGATWQGGGTPGEMHRPPFPGAPTPGGPGQQ